MATLAQLRGRAEAARDRFESQRGQLFRPDGTKVYSEEEHAQRLAALRGERNQVLSEVQEQLEAAYQEANAEIPNLENRDPTELLTEDELARANGKRGFALDAAEALDVAALRSRLESVIAAGDNASIFAHWMAGQRRREKILERRRESARRTSDNPATVAQISSVTELDDVLDRMHQAVDRGRTAEAIEAARRRLEEIFEVQQITYLARHETNSVYNPNYAVPGPGR